jgi:hypothetical protein
VVKVEVAHTPQGTSAGGSAVIVGQTVEATSVELRRKATPRSRVLLRCRGVRPRGSGDLAGKDFTPSLGVWRGQAMAVGFTRDGNRHSRLEA